MERAWTAREYREGDEEGILELHEAIYGKVKDKEKWMRWWNWRYRNGPAGASIIWIAEADGKLAGQYAITCVKMKVGRKLIAGSQSENTMTHPDYQRQGIFETLARRVYGEAEKRDGIYIVYGFYLHQNT